MKQRGRKTTGTLLATVELSQKRPGPPQSLNADMAALWHRVTGCFPADWFRPADWPLLESYCRHVYRAGVIDGQLDKFKDEWLTTDDGLKRYRSLLEARKSETTLMQSLARSMRITHQSRVHKDTAARSVEKVHTGPRPWE
jgi:phage terminase small subunit